MSSVYKALIVYGVRKQGVLNHEIRLLVGGNSVQQQAQQLELA